MTKKLIKLALGEVDNSDSDESMENDFEEGSLSFEMNPPLANSAHAESETSTTCDRGVQTALLGESLERVFMLLENVITLEEIEQISNKRMQAGQDTKATFLLDGQNSMNVESTPDGASVEQQGQTTNNGDLNSGEDLTHEEPVESASNEMEEVLVNNTVAISDDRVHKNDSAEEESNLSNLGFCSKVASRIKKKVTIEDLRRCLELISIPSPTTLGKGSCRTRYLDLDGSEQLSGEASSVLVTENLEMDVNSSVVKSQLFLSESADQDDILEDQEEEGESEVEMADPCSSNQNGWLSKQNGAHETKRVAKIRLEQWQWLCDTIPRADPDFLKTVVRSARSTKELKDAAAKFLQYPHLVETKEGCAAQRKWWNKNYSSEEILGGLADPLGYYYDNTKMVSEQYQNHVEIYLTILFPHVHKKEFAKVVQLCNYHLTSSYHVLNLLHGQQRAGDESCLVTKRGEAKERLPIPSSVEFYNELMFLEVEDEIKALVQCRRRAATQEQPRHLKSPSGQLEANATGGLDPKRQENLKRKSGDEASIASSSQQVFRALPTDAQENPLGPPRVESPASTDEPEWKRRKIGCEVKAEKEKE